ncbi:MAG: [protein-PII] uridylyltransferase [Jiangellaceae bacterium]
MTGVDSGPDSRFIRVRAAVVDDETLTAAQRRAVLTELSDAWLGSLFAALTPASSAGMALVAVGGYGRQELLPGSDLDVVLLHGDDGDAAAVANGVFYPVWDAGIALDHAVRTLRDARDVAGGDLAAALGIIDARHVAGDRQLTEMLRTRVLADWRRQAPVRLPQLAARCRERLTRVGELAHLSEPDLKEAYGGLRDGTALRAVAASWVADRPHAAAVAEANEWLLVVRDALHRTTGRRHDRLVFQDQDAVAERLGLSDADALMRRVAEAGRTIGYAADVTWRQVERALHGRSGGRRPVIRRPLADGVVDHDGEAALARTAHPHLDAVLPLRAAAAAAQAGVVLSPATLDRLVRECPPLPSPWPPAARDALVSLLGAGAGAVPVWDALDAAGLIVRWFPEWEPVRYRPQRTPIHRHTVDRHLVETAVVAAGLARRVARPDLLLLAALFHDLGKGLPGDHSETGASIAAALGVRLGLSPADAARLELLVRHHLLLPQMATRRDLDDPATVSAVVAAVGSADVLDLLAALTEADATAAGALAWSPFRARLVGDLVARVRSVLGGAPVQKPSALEPWQEQLATDCGLAGELAVRVDGGEPAGLCRVTVAVPHRGDALTAVAGVLAMHHLDVRAAAIHAHVGAVVQTWRGTTGFRGPPSEATLRTDIGRALGGTLDLGAVLGARSAPRVPRTPAPAEPRVEIVAGASSDTTVLEVRAHDEPGLLYRLVSALGAGGAVVRSAVVGTLGAEAVDVFYLVDDVGEPLAADAASALVEKVAATLALA